MARNRRMNIKIFKTDNISFVNRYHKKKILDVRTGDMFKPEFQDMFSASEQIGFLRLLKHGIIHHKEESYIMILTNVGILLLDPFKVNFFFI